MDLTVLGQTSPTESGNLQKTKHIHTHIIHRVKIKYLIGKRELDQASLLYISNEGLRRHTKEHICSHCLVKGNIANQNIC